MLRSLKNMEEYKVGATDGDIGSVSDFFFDDRHWTIRYLVVETGGFWNGPARVLISPNAFLEVEWATRRFHLSLTRAKVENSPALPPDIPLSRQYEQNYFQYYQWPYYWGAGGIGQPPLLPTDPLASPPDEPQEHSVVENHHLLRTLDVIGSVVQGKDKEIGHIQDFIVDDATWSIRYAVVNTRHWWSGKSVIVSPAWISSIDGKSGKVEVDLSAEIVESCPEWSPDQPVNREYEARLFDYYGRPAYWSEAATKGHPESSRSSR